MALNLKVFPLTEGWWETYAWLSKSAEMYVDFYLALPPLYTNFLSLILEYTKKIIYIRWVLLVIYFINVYLIYILCKNLTKSNYAVIGVFVSQILIINNNPVWLSKDYHTLVSLLATVFLIASYKLILDYRKYIFYSSILGFITALLALTKQNIALVSFISALIIIIFNKKTSSKVVIKSLCIYFTSITSFLSGYSYFYTWNWTSAYLNNDSKGTASTVLFRFITDPNAAQISFAVVALLLTYSTLAYLIKVNKSLPKPIKVSLYSYLIKINEHLQIRVDLIGYLIHLNILYKLRKPTNNL